VKFSNGCVAAAVSGDTVVCSYATAVGVYVKPKTGWKSIQTYDALLVATDPNPYFFSLGIDQGVVVVGDPYYNNLQGAAYLFVKPKKGWGIPSNIRRVQIQTARLTASDGQFADGFGDSVAIWGDTVAGAPYSRHGGSIRGAAYVFVKPAGGWKDMTQTAELTDPNLQYYGNLGSSIAVQRRTLVAGNSAGGDSTNFQGSAYVYVEPPGGWVDTTTPDAELSASDGQPHDYFGVSAGISGTTIVIGSEHVFINLTGAAYVFGP